MNKNKIKFVVDTASDIPDDDLKRLNIDMVHVPMVVDGVAFVERKSFSNIEYYEILNNAKEIPKTSRVPVDDYLDVYKKAFIQGYSTLISVTINAAGSGTHDSAQQAKQMLYEEHPEAEKQMEILVIDSKTYSANYGYPTIKAAEMAEDGADVAEIVAFLNDWIDRSEIYAACYTLKFAAKSGRIKFATAFIGEALGMRPIISLIDGETNTVGKVRGDKNIIPALVKQYETANLSKDEPILIICGENLSDAQELQSIFKKQFKIDAPIYHAGASIVTNIGPKALAIVYKGKLRR